MKKSYRPQTKEEEQSIINCYLNEGNQEYTSKKFGITRRVLKEVLEKHSIPLRSQPQSLKGRQIGSKNPNWKGGSADKFLREEFGGKFKTLLQLWSELIKFLDNHTCCECGEEGLDSHHIICLRRIYRDNLSRDLIWNLSNGITLCKSCHMKTHMNEELFEVPFQKLIKNRLNSVEVPQKIINTSVGKYRAKQSVKND
jgi:5-methylcytosine-specific restriction endonuclease McrA